MYLLLWRMSLWSSHWLRRKEHHLVHLGLGLWRWRWCWCDLGQCATVGCWMLRWCRYNRECANCAQTVTKHGSRRCWWWRGGKFEQQQQHHQQQTTTTTTSTATTTAATTATATRTTTTTNKHNHNHNHKIKSNSNSKSNSSNSNKQQQQHKCTVFCGEICPLETDQLDVATKTGPMQNVSARVVLLLNVCWPAFKQEWNWQRDEVLVE